MSEKDAVVVTSTFFYPALNESNHKKEISLKSYERKDVDEILKSWAEYFMRLYPNISIQKKTEKIKGLISKFSINGVIFHCDRSCKPQSLPQYQIKNIIEKELNIPCLTIDADSVDPRLFSEEQTVTRVEAFLECI